ncbi:DNA-directed RNA polymerase II subunit RPB9-like [Teleopsis dalmanni]|uniref:DNA-directed RNA polymerase II subunit RPB9-like n=1 Tax=Teleopsis dalmanni TaxID=139649 RepID=UPI0018CD2025|nr:DNA-directed RNA polymerase II subunit RPB9-like [Teleopsis dalmanni]
MALEFHKERSKRIPFLSLKFCPECHNTLLAREDDERHVLMYICRLCEFEKVAESNCVFINIIKKSVEELTYVNPKILSDPSLPRSDEHPCPKCKYPETTYFPTTDRGDTRMFYVCLNLECNFKWFA